MGVVSEIRAWNRGRELQRLQLKYAQMETDAFSFFRGTAHLFFRDWPLDTALDDAPFVWVCGDLHLENFGSFRGDDGRAYFDVNDFDEAALAPASWDLARLLTSLHLAELPNVAGLAAAFLDGYIETARRGVPVSVVETDSAKPIRALLEKTAVRSPQEAARQAHRGEAARLSAPLHRHGEAGRRGALPRTASGRQGDDRTLPRGLRSHPDRTVAVRAG